MSEHMVKKNNVIYIIPNDELFEKYINKEAFIDDYGRLVSCKNHRVIKELKETFPMAIDNKKHVF